MNKWFELLPGILILLIALYIWLIYPHVGTIICTTQNGEWVCQANPEEQECE